ncbi:MAG: potassium-transporting ATPase subunit KdpC [Actinobacteria bacterium]|nr:potassium-transporting ATPase subunit KdpC [Actinomycetota bacterium]
MASLGRTTLGVLAITAILGLAYPLLVTGLGQLAFQNEAQGSLIRSQGRVVGSRLAAQPFTAKRYFHPRPSATTPAYNAGGTTFANLGPTSPDLEKTLRANAAAIVRLEKPYNPGLGVAGVPVDAVTTSASGIDPDISPAYAALQARRVASVRHLALDRVQALIALATDGRSLGLFGEPAVDVLTLNLALDREQK